MRCLPFLALWLCAILTATAQPIRVVTWNAKWFPGGRPGASAKMQTKQMHEAQAILAALNPDVLLLQEVRDWDAVTELCSAVPGLRVSVVSRFKGWPQNIAIASKLAVDSAWYEGWQSRPGEPSPPRGYAFAAFKLPRNHLLLAYSVHMKSNVGAPENNVASRNEATRQLLAHAKEMVPLYAKRGSIAIVVGGDFNSDLDSSRYEHDEGLSSLRSAGLRWVWQGVPLEKRLTVPASGKYPPDCFDHILYGGLRLLSAGVRKGQPTSDHNPVIAVFQP